MPLAFLTRRGRMLRILPLATPAIRCTWTVNVLKNQDARSNVDTLCLEGIYFKIQEQAGKAAEDCLQRHLQTILSCLSCRPDFSKHIRPG